MRDVSEAGLELIKRFEGLKLAAYKDTAGVPTIGYGHTRGVKMGDKITLSQAQAFLLDDTAEAVAAVNRLVKAVVTQTQFDVLVSFTFNVGQANLARSTLLQVLNLGHHYAVPNQLRRWNRAGGEVVQGLVNRREAEAKLWESTLREPVSPVPRLGLWARIVKLFTGT